MRLAVRVIPALLCLCLWGCGGGNSTGSVSSPTSPSTPPSTPPSSPTMSYVPLAQTAFLGDVIVLNWSEMNHGQSDVLGITTGTTAQIVQNYLPEICDSCTPNQYGGFQYLAYNGMERMVLLMGTYDVIDSQPCFGGPTGWDGKMGGAEDPAPSYGALIVDAKQLFPQVSMVAGTIPPLAAPYNTTGCTAVLNTVNSEIKTAAAASNVPLIDFNSAVPLSDITTTGDYPGILPSAAGYAAMTSLYNQENQ